jgi:predicted PolB exonuclease-like 3'-5' exonuclease
MPKQSRLGDNAEIYQPRKVQSEKEKLSGMPMKKRLAYLWEYYRIMALSVVLGIGLVSYIIYTIVVPKADIQLNVIFVSNLIDEQVLEDYRSQLSEYLHLDSLKSRKFILIHLFMIWTAP